jgi:two-component system, OmpR family, response regulator
MTGDAMAPDKRLLTTMRVLVVEDDPDELEMMMLFFRYHGAEVCAVTSANQALATLATWAPDVLVSDITLPEMDGCDLIREIRRREGADGRCLPAVAVTGWVGERERTLAIDSGYQLYLSKPVALDTLVEVVAGLVRATRPAPSGCD